jgi:hypothetical protein
MIRFFYAALVTLSINVFADEAIMAASPVPITPDPEITTGDLCTPKDTDFEGYRYKENVPTCVRDVTWERKTKIYEAYNVPLKCRSFYTVDHYLPLSMGGSNHDTNLWPEHKDIKATRQNLEQELYGQLRQGLISQKQALEQIVYAKLHPPHVVPRGCN